MIYLDSSSMQSYVGRLTHIGDVQTSNFYSDTTQNNMPNEVMNADLPGRSVHSSQAYLSNSTPNARLREDRRRAYVNFMNINQKAGKITNHVPSYDMQQLGFEPASIHHQYYIGQVPFQFRITNNFQSTSTSLNSNNLGHIFGSQYSMRDAISMQSQQSQLRTEVESFRRPAKSERSVIVASTINLNEKSIESNPAAPQSDHSVDGKPCSLSNENIDDFRIHEHSSSSSFRDNHFTVTPAVT